MAAYGVAECRWFLDRPVSNSGRLKGIIEELAAASGWPWRVELVADPDACAGRPREAAEVAAVELPPRPPIVVATADSAILDRCPAWFNLARDVVRQHIPSAWVIEPGI